MGTFRILTLHERWYCSKAFTFCLRPKISLSRVFTDSLRQEFSAFVSARIFSSLSNLDVKEAIVEVRLSILEARSLSLEGEEMGEL